MKFLPLTALLFLLAACNSQEAQEDNQPAAPITIRHDSGTKKEISNPYAPIDASPVDIAYFPADYPVKRMQQQDTKPPLARVIYSRPHRQNRKIFGALLKYGEPWRLGANEATEIEFFKDATIQGERVPKGRYVMYAIPEEDRWTIVLNSNLFSWGLKQDPKNDKFRFSILAQHTSTSVEHFTMVFTPYAGHARLIMAWDDVVTILEPIDF